MVTGLQEVGWGLGNGSLPPSILGPLWTFWQSGSLGRWGNDYQAMLVSDRWNGSYISVSI